VEPENSIVPTVPTHTVQQWIDFCNKQETDYLPPTLKIVLDFLTNLYERGYSTVNTARSDLSSL
jgi:hypothetical protein